MPIRKTDPTPKADHDSQANPPPSDAAEGAVRALHQPDGDENGNPAGDQDIDTAGTDADEHPLTRPKAATARSRQSSSES